MIVMGELYITVVQSWIIFKCLYMPHNAYIKVISALPPFVNAETATCLYKHFDGGFFMPFFRENGGLKWKKKY